MLSVVFSTTHATLCRVGMVFSSPLYKQVFMKHLPGAAH